MSALFPSSTPPWPTDPEKTAHVDPRPEIEQSRRRWEARAAQWRARDLAEAIFGDDIAVRLQGAAGPVVPGVRPDRSSETFRGLLHMSVPFHDLDLHRHREALFRSWAALDPVLSSVPLVYLFEPVPAERGASRAPGADADASGAEPRRFRSSSDEGASSS